jgi:hypothetical protein
MTRRLVIVGIAVLGLALSGCGTRTHSNGTPGKYLKVINNTGATVTMKSCTASAAQAKDCVGAARIAPGGAADFPLAAAGTQVRLVVITGYRSQPVCFPIPPASLPVRKYATVHVTGAQTGNCIGLHGGSSAAPAGQ